MPAKTKAIKTPFIVDPSLRPASQVVVAMASELDLASDGTLVIAARPLGFARGNEMISPPGDLAGLDAECAAWSPAGSRIAVLRTEWSGSDQTGHLTVHAWPSGRTLATATLARFSSVSHGQPGARAPTLVWAGSDRVLVRSAEMKDPHVNAIHALDVGTGTLATHTLANESSYLFAIAVQDDTLFALFADAGEDAGLEWYNLESFELLGRAKVWGDCAVPTPSGCWVLGDDHWAWRVDWRAIAEGRASHHPVTDPKWKDELRKRWERNKELAARAKAKWDVEHLKFHEATDEDLVIVDHPEKGVLRVMHPEPALLAQAFALDDAIIVRDGVRVARWEVNSGHLVVTSLIDDPQRATTSKARHRALAVRGRRLALAWRKNSNSEETTCTVFELS